MTTPRLGILYFIFFYIDMTLVELAIKTTNQEKTNDKVLPSS